MWEMWQAQLQVLLVMLETHHTVLALVKEGTWDDWEGSHRTVRVLVQAVVPVRQSALCVVVVVLAMVVREENLAGQDLRKTAPASYLADIHDPWHHRALGSEAACEVLQTHCGKTCCVVLHSNHTGVGWVLGHAQVMHWPCAVVHSCGMGDYWQ